MSESHGIDADTTDPITPPSNVKLPPISTFYANPTSASTSNGVLTDGVPIISTTSPVSEASRPFESLQSQIPPSPTPPLSSQIISVPWTPGKNTSLPDLHETSISLPNSPNAESDSKSSSYSLLKSPPTSSAKMSPEKLVEISSSLRSRLSHALEKVQNGWDPQSPSPHRNRLPPSTAPPASRGTSGLADPFNSTPTKYGRSLQQQKQQPTHLTHRRPKSYLPPSSTGSVSKPSNASSTSSHGKGHRRTTSDSQIRTYDSFWKSHKSSVVDSNRTSLTTPPLLAPPSTTNKSSIKKSSHKRPLSISVPVISPQSPNREMSEVDAVESLMFLSSPWTPSKKSWKDEDNEKDKP